MEIRQEVSKVIPLPHVRDPFTSKNISILDTDHIINSVKENVKRGSVLERNAIFPFARGKTFAAVHVLNQLYQPDAYGNRDKWHKLSSQSANEGWPLPPQSFREFFEREYLPSMTFVFMGDLYDDAEIVERVRLRDPSDAPTAQLKLLLARLDPSVFAVDKSLSKTGVAVSRNSMRAAAVAGQKIDDGVSAIQAVTLGSAVTVMAVDALLLKVASALHFPKWMSRIAAIAVLGGAMISPERRSKIIKPFLPAAERLQDMILEALEGSAFLAGEVVRVDDRDGIEQRIAEVLVRYGSPDGMLAKDIHIGLQRTSPHLSVPSIAEIREIISNAPCFGEQHRYRYWFSQS